MRLFEFPFSQVTGPDMLPHSLNPKGHTAFFDSQNEVIV